MMKRPSQLDPELIEHYAGNIALYRMARRYFTIIVAAIFAVVLAKPALPKEVEVGPWNLQVIVEAYLLIGVLGLFFSELRFAVHKLCGEDERGSDLVNRIFVGYTLIGSAIFSQLFHELMTRS